MWQSQNWNQRVIPTFINVFWWCFANSTYSNIWKNSKLEAKYFKWDWIYKAWNFLSLLHVTIFNKNFILFKNCKLTNHKFMLVKCFRVLKEFDLIRKIFRKKLGTVFEHVVFLKCSIINNFATKLSCKPIAFLSKRFTN